MKRELQSLSARLDGILTEFKKLDLGSKPGEYGGCGLVSAEAPKVYYPTIYLPDSDDDFELPEKGKAVVEYKVTRKSVETRGGKTKHSATLDILSIEPEEGKRGRGDKESKKGEVAKMLSALVGSRTVGQLDRRTVAPSHRPTEFGYGERTRNGNGQFIANETGGADPTSMRQAYGPKRQAQQDSLRGYAAGVRVQDSTASPQVVINNAPPSRLKPGMVGAALGAGAMTKRGKRVVRGAGQMAMRGARAMMGQ